MWSFIEPRSAICQASNEKLLLRAKAAELPWGCSPLLPPRAVDRGAAAFDLIAERLLRGGLR